MAQDFKPRAYIKDGCPFSFKYLVFMAEAGLLDEIEIVRVRDGTPEYEAAKQKISERLGKAATFPAVEVEPTRYLTDSDRLIEHFARRNALKPDDMPVLSLYKETVFPQLLEHHKEKSARNK